MATKNKIIGISTACAIVVIITSYSSISYADNTTISSSGVENSAAGVDSFDSLLSSIEADTGSENTTETNVDMPIPTLYDMTTDSESGVNPEEINITSATPIAISNEVKAPNILEGVYQGNGVIKVGTTNVKVISKKLTKAVKGDMVELEIKGTIQNFSIVSVKVNGSVVGFKTVSITTEKPSAYQNGIFTITGVYSNATIAIEVGDKTKVRKLTVKNGTNYEGKRVSLQIKGTINDFKVVSPITVLDTQVDGK